MLQTQTNNCFSPISITFCMIISLGLMGCGIYDLPAPPECIPDLIGEWKFEEQRGTEVGDSRGNSIGKFGEPRPEWTETEQSGGALYFDGSKSFVHWDNEPIFEFGARSFTWESWIRPEVPNDTTTMQTIIGDFYEFPIYDIYLEKTGSLSVRISFESSGTSFENDGIPLIANEWQHIVVVFDRDAQEIRRYVEGKKYGESLTITGTASFNNNSRRVTIGVKHASSHINPDSLVTQPFKGLVDEVRVYSRSLTEDEILLRADKSSC